MRLVLVVGAVTCLGLGCGTPSTSTAVRRVERRSAFQLVASYRGLGFPFGQIVAPSPDGERLYVSFLYNETALDVVAIDPATGHASRFANPAPTEYGARAMTLAPDGDLYLGTLPNAHIFLVKTRSGELVDLGRPSASEQFIWDITVGPDKAVYGVTSPHAKLVRFDPGKGELADLGSMDADNTYARHVAASQDGFVYVGTGAASMNVVAFEIATGTHRALLAPSSTHGFAEVYEGTDGAVYAVVGKQVFKLAAWKAVPIALAQSAPRRVRNRTRDGSSMSLADRELVKTKDGIRSATTVDYDGNTLPIFRLGLGPDGHLYASTVMPARLLRVDEQAHRIEPLLQVGDGEIYSFDADRDSLLLAGYATDAPLMSLPITGDKVATPRNVHFDGEDAGWRPVAMVHAGTHRYFVGALAGYGRSDGLLCEWDGERGAASIIALPIERSISSLAVDDSGRLIIGTSVATDGSNKPDASIVRWDPRTHQIVDSVPLPGIERVNSLAVVGSELVAVTGEELLVVDRELHVTVRKPLGFVTSQWQSLARGPDGNLWGLANDGVYAIDPRTWKITFVASPRPVTAGFALRDRSLFFVSGSDVYEYTLPR